MTSILRALRAMKVAEAAVILGTAVTRLSEGTWQTSDGTSALLLTAQRIASN